MRCSIVIITGPIHSGKSTRLKSILEGAQKTKAGIMAEGYYGDDPSRKDGFYSCSIVSGERRRLLRSEDGAGLLPLGRFFYDPEVMDWSIGEIWKGISSQILVIDEIGHLELEKKGYYDVLNSVLARFSGELILVIREGLLEEVCDLFSIDTDQAQIIRTV